MSNANTTYSDAAYSAIAATGGEGGVNLNINIVADGAFIIDHIIKPAFDTSHSAWPWTIINLIVFSFLVFLIIAACVMSNCSESGADMAPGASAESDFVEEGDTETTKEGV